MPEHRNRLLNLIATLTGEHVFVRLAQAAADVARDRFGFRQDASPSYSLEGEDMLFRSFLDRYVHVWKRLDPRLLSAGCYVDVGAHHPTRHSNTALLYQRGWRGINIDCLPGAMDEFKRLRPDDVNLELAIADEEGERGYYIVRDGDGRPSPRSGFLTEERIRWLRQTQNVHDIERIAMRSSRLADVLDRHLPQGKSIDLLNIDAEGHDHEVLRSNDWARYRPSFILIETDAYGVADAARQREFRFLADQGYAPLSKLGISCLYVEASLMPEA